jgi:pimeloyl-ACP methyl ester carboxylesterase
MKAIPKSLAVLLSAALSVFLVSCSHPIEIAGDGDVTSESATRDCPLEEFLAGEDSCAKNYVALDYSETYYAEPRVGWDFHRWINYCTRATTNECSFNVPAEMVLQHWGETMPPLRAVFTNSNVWQGHACEMAIPEGLAESDFICGTFTAPLDWDNPFGETVDLEVAVLKSKYGLSKPDPYVYLGGGPGARNLECYLYREAASILSPIAASRDIIFIDKRGLGLADPSLLCPELGAQNQQIYGTIQGSPEDVDSLLIAYQNCHSRIAETGVNLSHFNSYQVANDLASLITVLGYDEYNLFGISYGTREALMMMRDHPEKIRSVILDSTSLPGGNPENWAPNFARSYELLFASCAASSTCSAAYPNLEETLVTVVNQLNDEPHLSQVTQEDGSILDVYITGDRFIIGLHGAMYEVNLLPLIPLVIHSTAAGDMGLLDAFVPAPGD